MRWGNNRINFYQLEHCSVYLISIEILLKILYFLMILIEFYNLVLFAFLLRSGFGQPWMCGSGWWVYTCTVYSSSVHNNLDIRCNWSFSRMRWRRWTSSRRTCRRRWSKEFTKQRRLKCYSTVNMHFLVLPLTRYSSPFKLAYFSFIYISDLKIFPLP